MTTATNAATRQIRATYAFDCRPPFFEKASIIIRITAPIETINSGAIAQ